MHDVIYNMCKINKSLSYLHIIKFHITIKLLL